VVFVKMWSMADNHAELTKSDIIWLLSIDASLQQVVNLCLESER